MTENHKDNWTITCSWHKDGTPSKFDVRVYKRLAKLPKEQRAEYVKALREAFTYAAGHFLNEINGLSYAP